MKIKDILNLFKSDLTLLPKERELNLINKRYLTKEKLKLMQKSIFKHTFLKNRDIEMQNNKIMIYAIDESKMKSEPFYKKVCSLRKRTHFLFWNLEEVFYYIKNKIFNRF